MLHGTFHSKLSEHMDNYSISGRWGRIIEYLKKIILSSNPAGKQKQMAEEYRGHAVSTKEMLCMGKVKRRDKEEWGRHM